VYFKTVVFIKDEIKLKTFKIVFKTLINMTFRV